MVMKRISDTSCRIRSDRLIVPFLNRKRPELGNIPTRAQGQVGNRNEIYTGRNGDEGTLNGNLSTTLAKLSIPVFVLGELLTSGVKIGRGYHNK